MRPVFRAITIAAVILVVLGSNRFSRVEAVEHHGYDADMRGNRDACLSCHNDKIAKSHSNCMPVCLFGKSHPDNKVYPPPNRKNDFKPVAVAENNGIMFIDGKMDCLSCHSLLVKSRYHLRINNWEKQICYACHQKLGTATGG